MFNDHLNYLKQAVLGEIVKSCLLNEPYLKSAVPNQGVRQSFSRGYTEGWLKLRFRAVVQNVVSLCGP